MGGSDVGDGESQIQFATGIEYYSSEWGDPAPTVHAPVEFGGSGVATGTGTGTGTGSGTGSGTGGTTDGGGQAHNNMQPTSFLNVMIKL